MMWNFYKIELHYWNLKRKRHGKKLRILRRKLGKLCRQGKEIRRPRSKRNRGLETKKMKKGTFRRETLTWDNKWRMECSQSSMRIITKKEKRLIWWNMRNKKSVSKSICLSNKTNLRMPQSSRWSEIRNKKYRKRSKEMLLRREQEPDKNFKEELLRKTNWEFKLRWKLLEWNKRSLN